MTRPVCAALALAAALLTAPARAGDYAWLEGEDGRASVAAATNGWGNRQFLSSGRWLTLSIEEGKVEGTVPPGGIRIHHPFTLAKAARYEVWNRLGYEFVRSAFDWRIDGGAWTTVPPDALTTDLMEIDTWCEVAWLRLGEADLPAGDHVLEIRLVKTVKADGKPNRILYASDALCLHEGPFRPRAALKPGEPGRDERDEAAAKTVFRLPEAATGQRAQVELKGPWEVARDDEQAPGDVDAPIAALPANPFFRAIPVPSDKNESRKDLVFAHRLWYRTKVDVPASLAGRSFFLDFFLNSLNTTVFVNGRYCGFGPYPFCRFQVDVTAAVRPGQVNEVWVGIRDAWYGRSADPGNPLKLRRTFNIPLGFFSNGFQDFDYPVWNCPQSGILATPVFVAAGPAYASDVFVKPSVRKRTLESDVRIDNPGAARVSGEIAQEVVDGADGRVVKTFPASPFAVEAGTNAVFALASPWADPVLWWPDAPHLYRLRTTLLANGKAIDTRETVFGFREWRAEGAMFTLNGVTWPLWADLGDGGSTPEQWLANYRKTDQRTFRFSTAGQAPRDPLWLGLEPDQALDFFDRSGVVVRRNTTLDGEMIGYQFQEKDPAILARQGGSPLKLTLMRNWRGQSVAQVRGERNHPSIQIWSIENEFAFINLINLLGNSETMDRYEREIALTHDAVMAADPTRSVMTDGGGALKDNLLGVAGDHYVATLDTRYPDLAYEAFPEGGGRGRWRWDGARPRFLGEDFFATGMDPSNFAAWGGEVAFQGKAAVKDAVALCYRMLNEGYRWGGHYAAWHFWLGGEGGGRQRVANAPRAVLCRQWDWTFGPGQAVTRTYGVFNDTRHPHPLTFTRTLLVDGRAVFTKTSTHRVAPGTAEKFDEPLPLPRVKGRTEAELVLTLADGDTLLFRDTKAVSILPPPAPPAGLARGAVAVYDPSGAVLSFLKEVQIPAVPVADLAAPPAGTKVLVVGPDALTKTESTASALAGYAADGHAVIVLDQAFPLKYQGLPADMVPVATNKEPFAGTGRTAFLEDASHPAFQGLRDKDFFTWGPGRPVYRNAYGKPARGGKSLLQCGFRLKHTALAEIPAGKGVLYVSQLAMGDGALASNAVARQLVANLVGAALAYKQEFAGAVLAAPHEPLAATLDAIGLQYARAPDAKAAIADPDRRIAIIPATPANLAALAGAMDAVKAFWAGGGTIVFHGLTPEGLADYNRIVGVEHLIRPFTRERVMFPPVRHPLTAGLSSGDLAMLSGKRIFGFRQDEYTVSDAFTHILDYDEIAPFGKSPFASYPNIVNGFIGADGWPLIIDFPLPTNGLPSEIPITFPRAEAIAEFTFDASVNYHRVTKIALLFDGKDRVEFEVKPDGEPQTFAIDPPRTATVLTLQLCAWEKAPGKVDNQGIDNIWIRAVRSPAFREAVKPMLNIGGLMHYPRGRGGVVLCTLNFLETEAVPANKDKKRNIMAAVLRNLKAPFLGGKAIIAGSRLAFRPIDIHTKATTFKDERGWFGNAARTFKGLPAGRHKLAGVEFDIYEMETSPVPQVLIPAGRGVPGSLPAAITDIPVNTKADALFFLHTARLDRRMDPAQREKGPAPVLFKYVVHYADGQAVEVPILAEVDIEHYVQPEPAAIPGAQVAWVGPYEGSEDKAVAYSKQWNNPRPDVIITSLDLVPVDGSRGVPALLALTAAQAE